MSLLGKPLSDTSLTLPPGVEVLDRPLDAAGHHHGSRLPADLAGGHERQFCGDNK